MLTCFVIIIKSAMKYETEKKRKIIRIVYDG